VWQWHRLPAATGANGIISLSGENEVWQDRFPDTQHRFRQGGLQPGDYQLFARMRRGGEVMESNLIEFKILAKNPTDAGMNGTAAATVAAFPAEVTNLVNILPEANFDGRAIPEFRRWYRAMLCRESGAGGLSYHQDFDQYERTPETATGDDAAGANKRDLGWRRGVWYGRGQNRRRFTWDVRFGFPWCVFDNGWGLSQQTDARNRLSQFGRWRANVIEGWHELTVTKFAEARNYICNRLYPGTPVENIPVEVICKEVVTRYNSGHYYIRTNDGRVIPDVNGNREYVAAVEPFYQALGE
jgi:hypothetical protein